MTAPTIPTLPTAPTPDLAREQFDLAAAAWVAALPPYTAKLNEFGDYLDSGAYVAQPSGFLASAIETTTVPAAMYAFVTSGYSTHGQGAGLYVSDSVADADLATDHPRFCKLSDDGRYWRLSTESGINVLQAGAVADNVTDDGPAFIAAIAYLKALAVNPVSTWYKGSGRLHVPSGSYYLGSTTLDITHTLIIEGDDTGFMDGHATKLRWTDGCTGIRVQAYDTEGADDTNDGTGFHGGDGTIIRNLYLLGGLDDDSTEGEYHAIHLRSRAIVENVAGTKWQGDGIHIFADVGVSGNASLCQVSTCRFTYVRTGVYLDGGDVNVCNIKSVDVTYARRWGFWDSAFLANRFESCHASNCGMSNPGYTPSIAVYSSKLYAVVAGQETGASTNAPSGTTADNTWWYYVDAGSASVPYNYVAWTSGLTWAAGGPYYVDNANAGTTLDDCYSEGGQGPSQLPYLGLAIGGTHGSGVKGARLSVYNAVPAAQDQFGVYSSKSGSTKRTFLGSGETTSDGILTHFNSVIGGASSLALAFPGTYPDVLHWTNWRGYYGDDAVPFQISMNSSSAGDAPWGTSRMNFPLGFGIAGKKFYSGTAVPSSGAYLQGDRTYNRTSTLTGVDKWFCSAAGSPGTQFADYVYPRADPSTGIGYVTGAGGAVTQATSRTTGVTLNKVCGAITLVSAAGSASWQTFTVTNSTVAATDTVVVSQKSGTDKNMIHVTAVAAGSFDITFATTGGTTTEQPVFNFAVLKAVAA